MPARLALLAFVTALLVASPAAGQPAPPSQPQPQPSSPDLASKERTESPNADAFPVSLDRIKRQLAQAPPARLDSLNVAYYIEVYGKAPVLELFKDVDLTNGAVPYGAPTHRDILQLVTPQEFRSPPADLTTAMRALIQWMTTRAGTRSTDERR